MHPILIVLITIGSFIGLYVAFYIGYNLDDWIRKVFSYRSYSTDSHLVITSQKAEMIRNSWDTYREPILENAYDRGVAFTKASTEKIAMHNYSNAFLNGSTSLTPNELQEKDINSTLNEFKHYRVENI